MGNQKGPKNVTSNISATANPSTSPTAHTTTQSSILKSSFAPSRFGESLFASVIQGLGSQHLRIHNTTTGRLHGEHAIASKVVITTLDWGYYGSSSADHQDQESKRKRKRPIQRNGAIFSKHMALAFGTSGSEIHIYSPKESKVLAVLRDAHSGGIRDFKFVNDGHESYAYSVGGDGRLTQWDLKKGLAILTKTIPNGPANAMLPAGSRVICASNLAYILNLKSNEWGIPYNASTNTVHTVFDNRVQAKHQKRFLTIAEIDHFINIFDEDSPLLVGSLRTETEIVVADFLSIEETPRNNLEELSVQMLRPKQALAALNKHGTLEIFPEPFDFATASSEKDGGSLKARMRQRSRKSAAQVKIVRPGKGSTQVPLINACFQNSNIALAWVEGGVNVVFDTVQWLDEKTGDLLLKDTTDIVKGKSGTGLGAATMNGVKDMGKSQVDDAQAVVGNGVDAYDISMNDAEPEVIDISSAEEESEFEEDIPVGKPFVSQPDSEGDGDGEEGEHDAVNNGDVLMKDVEAQDEPREEAEPPSFGDLICAHAPDPINVSRALIDGNPQSIVPANSTLLQALPSSMSLGTVLTQSLRTNDTSLLETCFHTKDLSIVRATIQRLDSSLAANLLQRLAERLHNRPGRAGSLMVWIQWTLVVHGGYLAGQPEVMRKLKSLHKVVKERAGSLQSLLSLKGKLDMLEAQMNLRRSVLERRRNGRLEEEDDEEAVIYVEGKEDDDSNKEDQSDDDDDDDDDAIDAPVSKSRATGDTYTIDDQPVDNEDEDDEMLPRTNGIPADDGNASDSEEDGLIDDEASETDNDSHEELGEDGDVDHESIDTESSDGDASPATRKKC